MDAEGTFESVLGPVKGESAQGRLASKRGSCREGFRQSIWALVFILVLMSHELTALSEADANEVSQQGQSIERYDTEDVGAPQSSVGEPSIDQGSTPTSYAPQYSFDVAPSSYIGGHVDPRSGSFCDYSLDFFDPLTELNMTRTYHSTTKPVEEKDLGGLYRCWYSNFKHQLKGDPTRAYAVTPNRHYGHEFSFRSESKTFACPDINNFCHGWTNTQRGVIGAQYHPINQRLYVTERFWLVRCEDGAKRIFSLKPAKSARGGSTDRYPEIYRRTASGLLYKFQNSKNGDLERIVACDSSGQQELSYLEREGDTYRTPTASMKIVRGVKNKDYTQMDDYYCDGDGSWKVRSIEYSDRPNIDYTYRSPTEKERYLHESWITKKARPDGRYIRAEYCSAKEPKVGMKHFGRVRSLHAPAGGGGEEVTLYKMEYGLHQTDVTDATGVQHRYKYFDERLDYFELRSGEEAYRYEYTWEKEPVREFERSPACRLKSQSVLQCCGDQRLSEALYHKEYTYDQRGNIIQEDLHGDISGSAPKLLIDAKKSICQESEVLSTYYTYSDDEYNLLLTKTTPEGHCIEYRYAPESNRLIRELERVGGQIIRRRFIDYDTYGNEISILDDDGHSEHSTGGEWRVRTLLERVSVTQGSAIGLIESERAYTCLRAGGGKMPLYTCDFSYDDRRRLVSKRRVIYGSDGNVVNEECESYEYDDHGNMTLEVTPSGGRIIRRYDALDNLIYESAPDESFECHMQYDTMDRLIQKQLHHEGTDLLTNYTYDPMGRLLEEINSYGVAKKYSYDALGRVASIRTLRPTLHSISEATQDEEMVELTSYDGFGRLIRKVDALGYEEAWRYNCQGSVTYEKRQNHQTLRHTYDHRGRCVASTYASGASQVFSYDALGRLIRSDRLDAQKSVVFTQSFEYEGMLLKSTSDSMGLTQQMDYDSAGNMIGRCSYEEGELTSEEAWRYDGLGREIYSCRYDPRACKADSHRKGTHKVGKSAQAFRRLEETDSQASYIATYTFYDNAGRIRRRQTVSSEGSCLGDTRYEYDLLGRVISKIEIEEEGERLERFEYDWRGHCLRYVDALGQVTRHEWSYGIDYTMQLGIHSGKTVNVDCSKSYAPDGVITTSFFDDQGNMLECFTEKSGRVLSRSCFGYDPYGGCVERKELELFSPETYRDISSDFQESLDWSDLSSLKLGEARWVTTKVTYGPARQVLKRIDAAGSPRERVRSWRYNDFGFLIELMRPSGLKLFYEYDDFSRLKRKVSSDGSIDVTYCYDGRDRLIEVSRREGDTCAVTRRTYNSRGDVIAEELEHGQRVERRYDALGRMIEMKLPKNILTGCDYRGGLMRHATLIGPWGLYRYDLNKYDCQGRSREEILTRVTGSGEGASLEGEGTHLYTLERSYDLLGRACQCRCDYQSLSIDSRDPQGRVLRVSSDGKLQQEDQSCCYDGLGQLTKYRVGKREDLYTYSSRRVRTSFNEKESYSDQLCQLRASDDGVYDYDIDGRLTKLRRRTPQGWETFLMSYDALDQLISVKKRDHDGIDEVFYRYDGFGRRISRICGNQQLDFIYDGYRELGSMQKGQWVDFRWLLGRSEHEGGDVLLVASSQRSYATLSDLNGSIIGWLDSEGGGVKGSCRYDAFGNIMHQYSSWWSEEDLMRRWGYASKRRDPTTAWIAFGRRDYMPSEGRWLTMDPAGEIDGSNLYGYLSNNPIGNYDAWGLAKNYDASDLGLDLGEWGSFIDLWGTSDQSEKPHEFSKEYVGALVSEKLSCHEDRFKTGGRCIVAIYDECNQPSQQPGVFFINGMNTSFDEVTSIVTKLAHDQQCHVLAVYNPTQGTLRQDVGSIIKREHHINERTGAREKVADVFETASRFNPRNAKKDRITSSLVLSTLKALTKFESQRSGEVMAFAHSEGSIFLLQALRSLHHGKESIASAGLKGYAFGGIAMGSDDDVSYYKNYIDGNDLFVKAYKGFYHDSDPTVSFTKARTLNPLRAHSLKDNYLSEIKTMVGR